MKTMLTVLLLAPGLAGAATIIQFTSVLSGGNEVPPNNSNPVGEGVFTLDGSDFSCNVETLGFAFNPTGGGIYGPAVAGQTAPLIFNLGNHVTLDPGGNDQGGFEYLANFSLTPPQITDLENGLWYVNLDSYRNPDGQIRGQIVPTPEPSTGFFLGTGLVLLGLRHWCKCPGQRRILLQRVPAANDPSCNHKPIKKL